MIETIRWYTFALCAFLPPALAQGNGMDMSTDGPMDLAVGHMLPYIHFTPGDNLWFLGWVPSSAGAMVGACIGIFLLAVLERWLAACLALAQQHWIERGSVPIDNSDASPVSSSRSELPTLPSTRKQAWFPSPPFVLEYDVTRGVLFTAQMAIKMLLMLAAMTFQLAFLLSNAIGSGVGEALFGRFSSSLQEH